ncbi:MAG: phosphatase [Bacteroidetes bacterium]|nr:phosphatase [Bacteroidota bacterium]
MKAALGILLTLLVTATAPEKKMVEVNKPDMIPNQEPIFSFGILADVQYCDCESFNTRFYRNSLTKLGEALRSFSDQKVDFIINLGDLIDREYESFEKVLQMISASGIPAHHCLGNHDFSVHPRDSRKVVQVTGTKTGYYSFAYEGFRFIMLNGNEIAVYSPSHSGKKEAERLLNELSEAGEPNAYDWNGGIGAEQLVWLGKELDRAVSNNEKVFLMCHFPVFPQGTHNLFNSSSVLTILAKYDNIISWFNGHNHDGGYGNYKMIHFVTFRGMVESSATNSFAVVDVYGNKLWIKGSGREKSQILAY